MRHYALTPPQVLEATDASLLFFSSRQQCLLLTDDADLFAAYGTESKFQMRQLDEYLTSTD
jgi:hypothetical protein